MSVCDIELRGAFAMHTAHDNCNRTATANHDREKDAHLAAIYDSDFFYILLIGVFSSNFILRCDVQNPSLSRYGKARVLKY